jgi:hypothetical protein
MERENEGKKKGNGPKKKNREVYSEWEMSTPTGD